MLIARTALTVNQKMCMAVVIDQRHGKSIAIEKDFLIKVEKEGGSK